MLATLQGLVYIAVVWVLMVAFDEPAPYHQCAAGFSGVLFALKVRKGGKRGGKIPSLFFFLFFFLDRSASAVSGDTRGRSFGTGPRCAS